MIILESMFCLLQVRKVFVVAVAFQVVHVGAGASRAAHTGHH